MNTNAKHTAGPWRADIEDYPFRREIYIETENFDPDAGEGERIARVFDETDTGRANAALIASAPDLLAALKSAVSYLEANRPKGNIREIFHQLNEYENGVLKPARAAIARAEGSQP